MKIAGQWFAHSVAPIGSRLQKLSALRRFELIWKDWDKCTYQCHNNNHPFLGNLGSLIWVRLHAATARAAVPSPASVHAGSFCVSVMHQTLTWTTGSLTGVRDHSYAWVYTHVGCGAYRQWVSTTVNIFYSEKLSRISVVLLTGFKLRSWNPLDLESDALPHHPKWPCNQAWLTHKYAISHSFLQTHNEAVHTSSLSQSHLPVIEYNCPL